MSRLSKYLPNSTDELGLVALDNLKPGQKHWPVRFQQIIGGKYWSLSIITYQTPAPVVKVSDPLSRGASSVLDHQDPNADWRS